MNNDTNTAFERLEARVSADANGDPLDRISVRDYTTDVEIGAFQVERGVTQRIKFNVVLEVLPTDAAATDDVDQVLSYDTITEAIEYQLHVERLNLLETLAERIAAQILTHAQALRAFVRIEKLDRIPGSLGVEIVRTRKGANEPSDNIGDVDGEVVDPLVVFMPNAIMHGKELKSWLDAIAAHDAPAVICTEPSQMALPNADNAPANRRIELLAIEQNAWVLAGMDPRCVVVDSRTELDWAMKNGQLSVWAPSKLVLDAVDKAPFNAKPLDLAAWFAAEFSADHVSILGSGPFRDKMHVIAEPSMLS
jgi:dihydroneopterin aldolase